MEEIKNRNELEDFINLEFVNAYNEILKRTELLQPTSKCPILKFFRKRAYNKYRAKVIQQLNRLYIKQMK